MVLLDSPECIEKLIGELPHILEADLKKLRVKHPTSPPLLAIDTEFMRESTFIPELSLIQIGTLERVWLVDSQALLAPQRGIPTNMEGTQALKKLLAVLNSEISGMPILKILHAGGQDQECFFTSLSTTLTPTLDTSLAASLLGHGDNIGLAKLLKEFLNVDLQKGHARTDWRRRPLPETLIRYAAGDVAHLVELGSQILQNLDRLTRRDWALRVSARWEKPEELQFDVVEHSKRFFRSGKSDARGFLALVELMRWREERARQINIPRRRLADEDVLVDLASARPKNEEDLLGFRGMAKAELSRGAKRFFEIFAAVEKESDPHLKAKQLIYGADLPVDGQRAGAKRNPATVRENQTVEFLQATVKILALDHEITARLLVTHDHLLDALRAFSTKELKEEADLERLGLLNHEARSLIGKELIKILQGETALCLVGTEPRLISVEKTEKPMKTGSNPDKKRITTHHS